MATEASSRKLNWGALANAFQKGATLREKQAAEAAAEQAKAVAEMPPPPDPNEVAVRAWAIRDEATFESLVVLVDALIQSCSESRRGAVRSHPEMAYYEGGCAALEALKLKLTKLRTS